MEPKDAVFFLKDLISSERLRMLHPTSNKCESLGNSMIYPQMSFPRLARAIGPARCFADLASACRLALARCDGRFSRDVTNSADPKFPTLQGVAKLLEVLR
jgi:hypothetical protein